MTLTEDPFFTHHFCPSVSKLHIKRSSPPLKVLDTHDPLVSAEEEAGHGSSAKRWATVDKA